MKKRITLILLIVFTIILISGMLIAQQGTPRGNQRNHTDIDDMPKYDLTDEQISDIKYIFEEEKMARDIYRFFYDKWNLRVFDNISYAEQRHLDEVRELIEKYDIPIEEKSEGEFINDDISSLYADLIEKGSISERDALEVGIMIEETDIEDLKEILKNATKDMEYIFENLLFGSERHLQAFQRNLEVMDDGYAKGSRDSYGYRKDGEGRRGKHGYGRGRYRNNNDDYCPCCDNDNDDNSDDDDDD